MLGDSGNDSRHQVTWSRADAVGALVGLGVEGGACGRAAMAATTRLPREQQEACSRNRRAQIIILQTRDEAQGTGPGTPRSGPATVRPRRGSSRCRRCRRAGGARYRLVVLVLLPEGSSTMVSFPDAARRHRDVPMFFVPMAACRQRSSPSGAARVHAGSPFEPGPVAVFSDGGLAGEGAPGRVTAGRRWICVPDRAVSVQSTS